jgi:hypothetical protein
MSTTEGLVPAASAFVSSESISAGEETPCGAAEKTARTRQRRDERSISSCDVNRTCCPG